MSDASFSSSSSSSSSSLSSPAGNLKKSKRHEESTEGGDDSAKKVRDLTGAAAAAATTGSMDEEEIDYEDPYGDEIDSEDEEVEEAVDGMDSEPTGKGGKGKGGGKKEKKIILEEDDDDDDEDDDKENNGEMETEGGSASSSAKPTRKKLLGNNKKVQFSEDRDAMEQEKKAPEKKVWRADVDKIDEKNEELDYDSSAYLMLHRLKVEWPSLSFDILPDGLGALRVKFPHTLYFVSGTQADQINKNKIQVFKASELHKTKNDDKESDDEDEEGEDEDDENDLDDDPILEEKSMPHPGAVNRIRIMPQQSNIVATWSAENRVYIWNIESLITGLDKPGGGVGGSKKPLHMCKDHSKAGFAMDWSSRVAGRLATGDHDKNILLWNPKSGGAWEVDSTPFKGHVRSVEDIQWSPSEDNIFASCSADRTIRIWDCRDKGKSQAFVAAHHSDVNVISWNRRVQHLLASGSDDGSIRVWDLRKFTSKDFAANLAWHKSQITSVEWSPFEESVLAAAGGDHQVTIWDLALEADAEEVAQLGTGAKTDGIELPPQLFFIHQGLTNPKELHWHHQISSCIVTTAEDGFNIFKPSNMQ